MNVSAIAQMTEEHQLITRVVNWLESLSASCEHHGSIDARKLRGATEFLRVYADQRHHQREEAIFFPLLVKLGVPPQGCPIGGLNHGHAQGREMVATLVGQIDAYEQKQADACEKIKKTLEDLVKHYRHHIWMEDAMVFPMGDRMISSADGQELAAKFDELDQQIGRETVERLEQFARSL